MGDQLLQYVLGGGFITAVVLALRWGRQDAADSAAASSSNTTVAMTLRNTAIEDAAEARAELAIAQAELRRLRALLAVHGIDPGVAMGPP